MIVPGASVLTDALIDDGPAGRACPAALGADAHWAAPDLPCGARDLRERAD